MLDPTVLEASNHVAETVRWLQLVDDEAHGRLEVTNP